MKTDSVICLNRKFRQISFPSGKEAMLLWLKSEFVFSLLPFLGVLFFVDLGLSLAAHCSVVCGVLVAIITYDIYRTLPTRYVWSSASDKKGLKKSKPPKAEGPADRRGFSTSNLYFYIPKVKLVQHSAESSDFTSYANAQEPDVCQLSEFKVTFCIEIIHGATRWTLWRTIGQFMKIRSELVVSCGEKAVPEMPVKLDDGVAFTDEFAHRCQRDVTLWLQLMLLSDKVCNETAFRQFLDMDPYDPQAALVGDSSPEAPSEKQWWRGSSIEDFQFLDESEESKDLYIDCSYNHNFKIRGLTYKTDRRKVDGGSPICKMIMLEIYEAQPEDGGRIDHVATKGRVKERIQVLNNLEGNPFVLVLNIQIPGDPPVSIVSYFVIPPDLRSKMTSPDDLKFMTLLDQFLDMPRNETDRLAAWGVGPDEGNSGAAQSRQGSDAGRDGDVEGSVFSKSESQASGNSDSKTESRATSDCDDEGGEGGDAGKEDDSDVEKAPRPLLGLKMPSMRQLMQGKKSSSSTSNDKKSYASSGLTEVDSPLPTNRKKPSLLTRSISKLSSRFVKTSKTSEEGETHTGSDLESKEATAATGPVHEGESEGATPLRRPGLSRSTSEVMSVCSQDMSAARSVVSETTDVGIAGRPRSTAGIGGKKYDNPKGPMGLPSDISWPSPEELGALPMDDFRNQRFKLIPIITDGPWVVKMAVRSTPVLLGQKVVQRYFRGEGYMEIDVHVGSSVIAAQIVGVCRSYTRFFSTNLAVVIQGDKEEELPERLLACINFNKLDLDVRSKL